jgi:hypothetical protein
MHTEASTLEIHHGVNASVSLLHPFMDVFILLKNLALNGAVSLLQYPGNDDTESHHCPMNNQTPSITIWLYQRPPRIELMQDTASMDLGFS